MTASHHLLTFERLGAHLLRVRVRIVFLPQLLAAPPSVEPPRIIELSRFPPLLSLMRLVSI